MREQRHSGQPGSGQRGCPAFPSPVPFPQPGYFRRAGGEQRVGRIWWPRPVVCQSREVLPSQAAKGQGCWAAQSYCLNQGAPAGRPPRSSRGACRPHCQAHGAGRRGTRQLPGRQLLLQSPSVGGHWELRVRPAELTRPRRQQSGPRGWGWPWLMCARCPVQGTADDKIVGF